MHELARAVIVDALIGSDKKRRLPWILGIVGVGLATFRWKAAKAAGVPLEMAFRHPFTPLATLRASATATAAK
jgi:hypothetical protein